MRTMLTRFVLLALVLSTVGAGVFPASAQGTKIKCDADLILSLYTAENSFNYAAVADKVMAAHPDMAMVDMSKLDYGQFTPLFDSMMKMMDANMAMPASSMNADMMKGMTDMMSMSMADMEKSMMASMPADATMPAMTTLAAGDIAGEPAECTALRASLRQFYSALAYEGNMMPMMEATPAQ